MIRLENTTVAQISEAITEEKRERGALALGFVLTLVVVADESDQADALAAASGAAAAHPMRIVLAIPRPGRGPSQLDAEISIAGDAGPGEVIILRLRGGLAAHAQSVVLPLLVPDAPVVTWWASEPPDSPGSDPLGMIARRRITDSGAGNRGTDELHKRATSYSPGDTDLAWTRLTPWRALLASALDRPFDPIVSAEVASSRTNASAPLLVAWLSRLLRVPVTHKHSRGPGITSVTITTEGGPIKITRPDGVKATLSVPGYPDSEVPLRRRTTKELLLEELKRLDPDEVYADALSQLPDAIDDALPETAASN